MVRPQIQRGAVKGVHLEEIDFKRDHRGAFLPLVNQARREIMDIVDVNISYSHARVARGMHLNYLRPQSKLIKVLSGKIIDFWVDLRADSPTFGHYDWIDLTPSSMGVFLPKGLAHGFHAEEDSLIAYITDVPYQSKGDYGVSLYTVSEALGNRMKFMTISDKDRTLPWVTDFCDTHVYSGGIWNRI